MILFPIWEASFNVAPMKALFISFLVRAQAVAVALEILVQRRART
ncbi:MAG TPA: hypothetical protein VGO11_04170 [Chthoniobacteraceae bacterium]|jgi:hypothetical protein|nr:hypothetical protein [Chthoniobacteraceae bacterium]